MIKPINSTQDFEERMKKNGQFYLTRINNALLLFVELPSFRAPIFQKHFRFLAPATSYTLPRRKEHRWFIVKRLHMLPDTLDTETKHHDAFKLEKEKINLFAEQHFGEDGKILFEIMSSSACYHHQKSIDDHMKKVRQDFIIKQSRSEQSAKNVIFNA